MPLIMLTGISALAGMDLGLAQKLNPGQVLLFDDPVATPFPPDVSTIRSIVIYGASLGFQAFMADAVEVGSAQLDAA